MMNKLKAAVVLALGIAWIGDALAEQGDITVHTVTAHVGVTGLNVLTPGVAYDFTDHLRAGFLARNSYGFRSVYGVAYTPMTKYMSIGAGFISGYGWDGKQVYGKRNGIIPMVAAEFHITDNIGVTWFGQAFNLTFKF